MTVNELISALQQVDQDAIVMVDGYEGGYCGLTVDSIVTQLVELNVHSGYSYFGPHDDVQFRLPDDTNSDPVIVRGVILKRI